MAIEIRVPDIGAGEMEVTAILVQVGDSLTQEQALLTVEGDKAALDIPAPCAGVVQAIKVAVGDKVATGVLIMEFAPTAELNSIDLSAKSLAEPSPAPAALGAQSSKLVPTFAIEQVKPEENDFAADGAYAHASPLVRKMAREFEINLSEIKGSGRKNRITPEDLTAYIKHAVKQLAPADSNADSNKVGGAGLDLLPWPEIDFNQFGPTEVVALTKIQQRSGANLARNWVRIPHVTQWDHADITELETFRTAQNALEAKKDQPLKITILAFVIKAVARALSLFPTFNASLAPDGRSLILKHYINIGVAVDTPNGLVVPVLRDVNNKGIYALSQELAALSHKARAGKLTAAEMQGGSFTVSSLGGIGGAAFTPIINAPEVAILGVSKAQTQPVWNGKEFAPRLQLPLSLSFDHRVIDGAQGARFICYLTESLSDIRRLIM